MRVIDDAQDLLQVCCGQCHPLCCCTLVQQVEDANSLNKLINKVSNIIGMDLDSLNVGSEKQMFSKIRTVLDNASNSLHDILTSHRNMFSERLRLPKCTIPPSEVQVHTAVVSHPNICTFSTEKISNYIMIIEAPQCHLCLTCVVYWDIYN